MTDPLKPTSIVDVYESQGSGPSERAWNSEPNAVGEEDEMSETYAEMFEIAQGTAQAWKHRAEVLLKAVEFYARHEHWMTESSSPGSLNTLLISFGDEGWWVAEEAMRAVTVETVQP